MANAIELAGLEHFDGKIVIDASDPLDFSSGRPGMFATSRTRDHSRP
jgi:hypothetical protein